MTRLPQLTDCRIVLDNGVGILTFERDEVRNALTGTAIASDLLGVLEWAADAPEISVLIITGAGSAFCAGGNIKQMPEMADMPPHVLQHSYSEHLQRLPRAMQRTGVVLIAAINGPAIGAGCDLSMLCDLRIAATTAKFSETYINLGLVPALGGPWLLQRLVGFQRAAELVLSGRLFDAKEALDLGLVLAVTEPAELLGRARDLAVTIASKPPLAVRYVRQLLRQGQTQAIGEHLELAASFQAICHKTDDHREAVSAFIDKRKPDFKGR